jgi:hypothetical protein
VGYGGEVLRLTATLSRDLFERDFDGDEPPDQARRTREGLIMTLLGMGYDVTLTEPTKGILDVWQTP